MKVFSPKLVVLAAITIGVIGASIMLSLVATKERMVIPILQIAEHPALDETRRGIKETLLACCNIAVKYESAQGDALLAQQIAQKMIAEKPQAIIAIGTVAAQSFLNKNSDIPIVFSSVTDPMGAKLVQELENPGGNQTGVSNLIPISPQLTLFKEIIPNLRTLGFIYNQGEPNSLVLLEKIRKDSVALNIKIVPQVANSTSQVRQATESVIQKVDAIYISNDRTALSALTTIIKVANREMKPVFVSDTDAVDLGAVAALGPSQYEVGVKTAEMIRMILDGDNPAQIPVAYPDRLQLKINLKAANEISLDVAKSILQRADKIIK